MPKKLGRDLRPDDLLIDDAGAPTRLTEVTWTTGGLHYTAGHSKTQVRVNPDGEYEVAHPMPAASMEWSAADQAWVVTVSTEGIPDTAEARVRVMVDGAYWSWE